MAEAGEWWSLTRLVTASEAVRDGSGVMEGRDRASALLGIPAERLSSRLFGNSSCIYLRNGSRTHRRLVKLLEYLFKRSLEDALDNAPRVVHCMRSASGVQ